MKVHPLKEVASRREETKFNRKGPDSIEPIQDCQGARQSVSKSTTSCQLKTRARRMADTAAIASPIRGEKADVYFYRNLFFNGD